MFWLLLIDWPLKPRSGRDPDACRRPLVVMYLAAALAWTPWGHRGSGLGNPAPPLPPAMALPTLAA